MTTQTSPLSVPDRLPPDLDRSAECSRTGVSSLIPGSLRSAFLCAVCAILSTAPPAQTPSEESIRADLTRYEALPLRARLQLDRRLSRVLQALEDPALTRIRQFAAEGGSIDDLPEHSSTIPFFDPQKEVPDQFEKGVAPARRPLPEDDERLKAAREDIPLRSFLPELHRRVDYDLASGTLVRRPYPTRAERFENLLRGFAPDTDFALARALSLVDKRKRQERARGAWFEHQYCDRSGWLFPGIRLYDAWTSGVECEVPDVDSFAWRRTVERKKGGEAYEKLYPKLSKSARIEREFREIRHALALAFVTADATMDVEYRLLVPRFHALLVEFDDDLKDLEKVVRKLGRDGVVKRIDERILKEPSGPTYRAREGRRTELEQMRDRIRAVALRELTRTEAGVRR